MVNYRTIPAPSGRPVGLRGEEGVYWDGGDEKESGDWCSDRGGIRRGRRERFTQDRLHGAVHHLMMRSVP